MHRYEELEQLYYKKKYKKVFLLILIVILLLPILFFIFIKNNKKHSHIQHKDINVTKIEKKEIIKNEKNITKLKQKENNISKTNIKKDLKKDKLSLNPILPKIPITEFETKQKEKKKKNIQEHKKVVKSKKIEKKVEQKIEKSKPKKEIQKPKAIVKVKSKPKPQIIIKEEKKPLIIKKRKVGLVELIDLFNQNKNYNLAIKIAKIYLEREDYSETIRWCKIANKINPSDYQSWFIFSKTLIQLRKINKATEVLHTYLETYGPEEHIRSLLRSIR